jgi:apolipoprotein N-acyltransferase
VAIEKSSQVLCKPGLAGDLAAAASATLVTLSLAPFAFWPLSVASLLILIYLLQELKPTQAARRGWFFGMGLFASGTSWVYVSIHVYGNAGVPLALFLIVLFCAGLALFGALTCWIYVRFLQNTPLGKLLGFPAIWVLGEWFRSWFLTGFPWLLTGYSQTDGPLQGWVPLLGVYGISLLIALTASSLHWLLEKQGAIRWLPAVLCLLIWISGPLMKQIEWVEPQGPAIEVSLVQANIPQELKWLPEHLDSTLDTYLDLTDNLWGKEVIIWPEAAIPRLRDQAVGFLQKVNDLALQSNSALITGIPTRQLTDNNYRFYNSIIAMGRGGGNYSKQRLVPFGEYVPLENWLGGLIQLFDLPMSSFSGGRPDQAALNANGIMMGASICYEVVYPNLVSRSARQADILITLSNDTWFGGSIGPLQHLQMARLRALENGRYMLRATNNGISAIIDHNGKVVVRGQQFTREVINGQAQPMAGMTPVTRFGYYPALAISIMLLLVTLVIRRSRTN